MRISDWSSDVCSSDLLGMRDTRIGDPDPAAAGAIARSYTGSGFELVSQTPAVEGAGGMRTTAADLGKWMEHFWNARAGVRPVYAQLLQPAPFRDGRPSDFSDGLAISRSLTRPTPPHGG